MEERAFYWYRLLQQLGWSKTYLFAIVTGAFKMYFWIHPYFLYIEFVAGFFVNDLQPQVGKGYLKAFLTLSQLS